MTKSTNTGTDNTGENNSGNCNSGDWNSGDRNSGDWNSGDRNSGDLNSGDRNSGDWNSGNLNSGNWNSGDRNSGDWNRGYRETGIFNTTEGTLRLFNQPTDLKWDDITHPNFYEFYLNKWIPESDMTDEEKKADPQFFVREGYLKTYTWEEAWANYWKDTTEEDRQRVLNLPNFDATVFKEITGISVNEKSKTIEIGGKTYEVSDELTEVLKNLKER